MRQIWGISEYVIPSWICFSFPKIIISFLFNLKPKTENTTQTRKTRPKTRSRDPRRMGPKQVTKWFSNSKQRKEGSTCSYSERLKAGSDQSSVLSNWLESWNYINFGYLGNWYVTLEIPISPFVSSCEVSLKISSSPSHELIELDGLFTGRAWMLSLYEQLSTFMMNRLSFLYQIVPQEVFFPMWDLW